MPDATRTTAPASLTSIAGAAGDAARGTGADGSDIGHDRNEASAAACGVVVATVVTVRHAARRQPNTCCEQTCQRRATSDTRAPGARVSSTIRAFSSADQRRRRPGPVRTSTRRNSPFASSLTSNITIARSPLCLGQLNHRPGRSLKKGVRAPLTLDRLTDAFRAASHEDTFAGKLAGLARQRDGLMAKPRSCCEQ